MSALRPLDQPADSSRLKSQANLLVMPTLDAANISFNFLKVAAGPFEARSWSARWCVAETVHPPLA